MGFSLYLVFRNRILRPNRTRRLVLLSFLFLVYLLAGASIFYSFNSPLEIAAAKEWNIFRTQWVANHTCLTGKQESLDEFISLVLNSVNSGIVFTYNSSEYTQNWMFGGETIFFAFTLLTTIGYGHATPLTNAGKLFCVVYIVIGVPLTMILLTLIVERIEFALTKNSTALEKKNDKKKSNYKKYNFKHYASIDETRQHEASIHFKNTTLQTFKIFDNAYLQSFLVLVFLVTFVYIIPSLIFSRVTEKRWTFLDAIYFSFISITTIGFGDFVPGNDYIGIDRNIYRLCMAVYLFFGIIINMLFLNIVTRLPVFSYIQHLLNLQNRRKYYEIFQNEQSDDGEDLSSSSNYSVSVQSSPPSISSTEPNSIQARPSRYSTPPLPTPPLLVNIDTDHIENEFSPIRAEKSSLGSSGEYGNHKSNSYSKATYKTKKI